jgi:hypothetical protein
MNLLLVARSEEKLHALAETWRSQFGITVDVCAADLSKTEGVEAVCQASAVRDVGVFVAAAGFGTSGAFVDAPLGPELAMLDVNCRAVLVLTHQIARSMRERGRGSIVLFSSLVAFQGVARAAHYAATKAYIQTFAEGLGVELAPHGVQVIACAPGPVQSGFGRVAGMKMGLADTPLAVARATIRNLGGSSRTLRPGRVGAFLQAMLATAPRFLRVRILAVIMKGMTQHQSEDTKPEAGSP